MQQVMKDGRPVNFQESGGEESNLFSLNLSTETFFTVR